MNVRCLVVCPIATGGGVTEAFLTSLDMLSSHGVVPIAAVPHDFHFTERIVARGYDVHQIRHLARGGWVRLLQQSYALAATVRKVKPNIVVLNNGRHIRMLKRLVPGIPIVSIYHGGKVDRFMSSSRVITINDHQLEVLVSKGYPASKVVVVDNALPISSLPPYEAKVRKNSGSPVVGTLRLLEPAKGVDVLIEAIGILAKRGTRLKTRIGSSGSMEAKLKAQVAALGISDLVEFCGWVEDKAAYFSSLDIYVLPSRSEEWGIGIVEANAARLPVVATACLGPMRIVRPGATGLLVPPGDPAALANAIERLARDPVFAEKLASAAYNHCAESYLFPTIAPIFTREVLAVLEG